MIRKQAFAFLLSLLSFSIQAQLDGSSPSSLNSTNATTARLTDAPTSDFLIEDESLQEATLTPTKSPTSTPTSSPSTVAPTITPSSHPTQFPTNDPYLNVGPFQIRLHWTPESCWQGNCNVEKNWCLQCEGRFCNRGDILWIEPCRDDLPDQQLFSWVPIPTATVAVLEPSESKTGQHLATTEWGQLRIRDVNEVEFLSTSFIQPRYYCLERAEDLNLYTLQHCNATHPMQQFSGFDPNPGQPFELHPPPTAAESKNSSKEEKCLNMHHHPRHYVSTI